MEKRFIYGLASQWYGENNANKSANEEKFANSIVFIQNDTDPAKGAAIFARGAYFETNNTADVENIIKTLLNGKGNIEVEVDTNGNLTISEKSINSLTGQKDSTELVQAKAVAGALTTPVSLTLAVANGVGTFSETFQTLNGDTTDAVTAVFESGDNITLTKGDSGLKISATNTTYSAGTGLRLDGTVFNHNTGVSGGGVSLSVAEMAKQTPTSAAPTFTFKTYGYDDYGHILGSKNATVELPATAFKDTTYTADKGLTITDKNVIEHTNSVTAKTTAGGETVTLSSTDKDFKYDQFTYDAQGHITGVTEHTITLPESAFVNDNTTYTGEKAIVVDKPEEGEIEGKISLKIADGEKFLSQDANGLKSTIDVKYDKATNYIYLEGANGSKTTGFDASAFVEDSFLKDVEIVDQDDENKAGKFLKFTFETVDTDGSSNVADSTKVIYVDVATWFHETVVEGNATTYLVVETGKTDNGSAKYTVRNTLGTITRDNSENTITVVDGLATVGDIKAVLETIDSDLDATVEGTHTNEIAVVTGITQVNGKITLVDSGLAATKAYVDGVIEGLDSNLGTEENNPISGDNIVGSNDQLFTKIVIKDGKLDTTGSTVANVADAKLVSYLKKSTEANPYVAIDSTTAIVNAIEELQAAWDWGTIA